MPKAAPQSLNVLQTALRSVGAAFSGIQSGSGSRRRKAPVWAPRAFEVAAVVVMGIALARIVGAWLYPLPVSDAPAAAVAPAARDGPVVIANPFRKPLSGGTGQAAQATGDAIEAADTSLNLTLYGTWAEDDNASATIGQPNGPQKVYRIGEEICCGARLEKVFTTHVLINRGGAIEALRLPNKSEQPGAGETAPILQAQGVADFSSLVTLQPTISPSGKLEISVAPAGDPETFVALGLQENDVVVSVNGQNAPQSADKIADFLASIRGAASYKVVVRRGGALVTVDVALPLAARSQEG